jgi:hypothetical protein
LPRTQGEHQGETRLVQQLGEIVGPQKIQRAVPPTPAKDWNEAVTLGIRHAARGS